MSIFLGVDREKRVNYPDIGPLVVTHQNHVLPKGTKAYNQKCSQLSFVTRDVPFGPKLVDLSHVYPFKLQLFVLYLECYVDKN